MTAALWEDRGHAALIRKAAHDLDLVVWVQPDFTLLIRHADGRTLAHAQFSTKGILRRSTVRTLTNTRHMFAETAYTPAEAARGVIAWLHAGHPLAWTFNPWVTPTLDAPAPVPLTGDGLAPVTPIRRRP